MTKFTLVDTYKTPVNHLWQQFISTIKQLKEKFVPSRMSSTRYS